MTYEPHLFHEKRLTSVEANTRRDGAELLVAAAEIPIRPVTTRFPLSDANEALIALKEDRINGTESRGLSAGRRPLETSPGLFPGRLKTPSRIPAGSGNRTIPVPACSGAGRPAVDGRTGGG